MKAISIRQPWAWLILHAGKDIENRSWSTNIRGRILIHTGRHIVRYEHEDALILATRILGRDVDCPRMADMEAGGIIGSVEIVDCITRSDSPWFFGKFGFVLKDPRPAPFFKVNGQLGFFEVDYPHLEAVA